MLVARNVRVMIKFQVEMAPGSTSDHTVLSNFRSFTSK